VTGIKTSGEKNLMLFSGRAHPELAREVAEQLGVDLVPTKALDFANGEIYVRYEESVRGADAFVLQSHTAPINQWNFVSFLLWSSFKPGNPVTWTDLQPVFEQYANLYPVMIRFLNLADYDQVKANAGLLSLAFGLDVSDPNSMPVTRDLSPAKRQAILAWLQNPLPGTVALRAARAVPADRPAPTGPVLPPGGKAAAAARRLILQKH